MLPKPMPERPAKLRSNRYQRRVLLGTGLFLCVLELWKQLVLWLFVYEGRYNVWYVPFQLCSMPLYFCPLCACILKRGHTRAVRVLAGFLADYGLLGGIAALLVHDGFTFPGHPFLTLHGYVWHLVLIALSLYLCVNHLPDIKKTGYLPVCALFLCCAGAAMLINILLHPFGDCDMFYISPYHPSSQPVFHEIDTALGRPFGILTYLFAVIAGGFLCHCLLAKLSALWGPRKR